MHSITALGIWNIQISIAARELVREADGVFFIRRTTRRKRGKWKDVRGRWTDDEEKGRTIVAIERRRKWKKKGKEKKIPMYVCAYTCTNLRRDGRPYSPMINRSPLLHNRLVISHEYYTSSRTTMYNNVHISSSNGHTLDFPEEKQKTADAFQQ